MIKVVFCLRRKAGLSQEDFQRYWRDEHADLVRSHADVLRIRRYVQSHTFHDPRIAGGANARGSEIEAYDGVAELWWDSVEELIEAASSDEGRAASRALMNDERRFIDLAHSPIFHAVENSVLG